MVNEKKEKLNIKNLTFKKKAKKIFDIINNKKRDIFFFNAKDLFIIIF